MERIVFPCAIHVMIVVPTSRDDEAERAEEHSEWGPKTGTAKAARSARRFGGSWSGVGVSGAKPLTMKHQNVTEARARRVRPLCGIVTGVNSVETGTRQRASKRL